MMIMTDELKKIRGLLFSNNFSSLMDESPFMFWFTDKKKIIYISKSLLGFMKEDKTKSLNDLHLSNIHPDDVTSYEAVLNGAFESQTHYITGYRLKNAAGEYVWIQEEGLPIFFRGDNTYKGFVSGCVNVDAQKKAENKLQASEERYRRLFETARDGILILNSETGKITDVNPFLIELLGYSKKEFLGFSVWELGAFKNVKASKEMFKVLQEEGYVKYDDLPLETKDGRLIPVGFVSNAYVVGNERVIQCNIRDISEQKRLHAAEKSLVLLKQDKIKSSFIADVTHELRTPLAIIKGNVDLALRTQETPETTKETYDAINTEVNHLAEILTNLSILTNESKEFSHTLEKTKIDISKVIKEVVVRLKKLSRAKNITIETKALPVAMVCGSKNYLEKLFSNIISNAIFYGKDGGIVVVSATLTGSQIAISIRDNGIGISKEELPNIFERFYRTEKAREVNHEGTGLGLAISKWIAELHRGSIAVISKESQGTTFIVTLPLPEF